MSLNHIPIYEGDEDTKWKWFVCEIFWDATDITDEDKKMTQFGLALQARALTWFMNFNDNQRRLKEEIKHSFLAFFKTQEVSHLDGNKLKEIKQSLGETIREYNKRFKYLLIQTPSVIEELSLLQMVCVGLLQKLCAPLQIYDIQLCEEGLKKS